jgi:hypothetical protein
MSSVTALPALTTLVIAIIGATTLLNVRHASLFYTPRKATAPF